MLRAPDGATIGEIIAATGWQSHYADVRIMPTCDGKPSCGAMAGALKKKLGLDVTSEKDATRGRTYKLPTT